MSHPAVNGSRDDSPPTSGLPYSRTAGKEDESEDTFPSMMGVLASPAPAPAPDQLLGRLSVKLRAIAILIAGIGIYVLVGDLSLFQNGFAELVSKNETVTNNKTFDNSMHMNNFNTITNLTTTKTTENNTLNTTTEEVIQLNSSTIENKELPNPKQQQQQQENIISKVTNRKKPTTNKSNELPTTSNELPKPILFMHLAKCGGSAVCEIMQNSMPLTNDKGQKDYHRANCNVQFFNKKTHHYAWIEPHHCTDLQPFTTQRDINGILQPYTRNNFIAIERAWYDEMPCPHFRSFSIVRHPVERYASLMRVFGLSRNETRVIHHLKGLKPVDEQLKMRLDGHPVNSWTIRQLLGYERLIDPTPVTIKDLERAKELVDRFHAFVPLEYLSHPNVLELLERARVLSRIDETRRTW